MSERPPYTRKGHHVTIGEPQPVAPDFIAPGARTPVPDSPVAQTGEPTLDIILAPCPECMQRHPWLDVCPNKAGVAAPDGELRERRGMLLYGAVELGVSLEYAEPLRAAWLREPGDERERWIFAADQFCAALTPTDRGTPQ